MSLRKKLITYNLKLRTKSGLTLIELIIASILMGLVMMGVISLDYAMRRTYRVSAMSADVSTRISGAMVHIFNRASLAVGMSTDLGLWPFEDASVRGLVLRQDRNNTPGDFTDDTWIRYIHNKSGGGAGDIYYCEIISDFTNVHITPGAPPALDATVYDPASCVGTQYFLTHVYPATTFTTYTLINDPGNFEFYLQVDMTGRNSDTDPVDPIKNKEYKLSTRVTPLGHTF
ncbi:MAG: hypothetical protein A2Z88_08715 [Omnitrophica WOR_2 bacterium GWA2_47_8]|nr:MAG: hypothetical protein A2Z88_08715 [Omnitrophica WOR_2 bacterium GWA2_47_8]